MNTETAGANFSRCRRFRYTLWRQWDSVLPLVMVIGLNPSTAGARQTDPTIRRCIGFARDWGYGGVVVANLFAYRATYPADLKAAVDPIGPRNDVWIRRMAGQVETIVAAWGNYGTWVGRSAQVQRMLNGRLHCLRINAGGEPAHPLYLPARLAPRPWSNGQDSPMHEQS